MMDSSTKLISEQDAETKALLVEKGVVSLEDLPEAEKEYETFIAELEKEWTPAKVKEWFLNSLRTKCKWVIEKRNELEKKNRDDRVKGLSFKLRQKTHIKIEDCNKMFALWRKKGIEMSRMTFSIRQFVRPTDAEDVHKHGVEHVLLYAIMGIR